MAEIEKEKKQASAFDKINLRSYLSSLIIIVLLMILTYVLTFVLPAGKYIDNVYTATPDATFPVWKFFLSPLLILGSDGNLMLIGILVFLCIIGGVFETLTRCKFMTYLLSKVVNKFYKRRYLLIYIVVLFFMLLGSFVGTFEEVIPLIPFMCALSVSLGFDNLIGLGISLLAAGSGFACGVMNPFTIGIAQQIAEVPMFSGIWLRIVSFVLVYLLLISFLTIHARRVEKKNVDAKEKIDINFVRDPKLDKAILFFGITLGTGLLIIICSTFIKFLQDYTLYIIALAFLIAGIGAALVSGMKGKELAKGFGKGCLIMIPAIVMILLASSIRYILVESSRLDTMIYNLINITKSLSPYLLILVIYLIVFITEIFIASGSAKAFLLIPLIMPIATALGLPANLVCLAYIFGDGFSNYIYPSDAALLISLKLSDTSYGKYMKQTWVYHLLTLIITSGILLLGVAIGYH